MSRSPELDLTKYPSMVRWFDPRVLFKEVQGVLLSAWFGSYADHRYTQAALDRAPPDRLIKRADHTQTIEPDQDGAIWIDFVADIGDGFDATYAVAYLLAQDVLSFENGLTLPRGSVLIIGGDVSYPSASRENYWVRMRQPYMLANPNDESSGAFHPRMYVIPGNHDWYDGLSAFHGTFCRALDEEPFYGGLSIGNWRCEQYRSYFAIKLPNNWWIWGLDIQLSGYIDQPQVNYFRLMAKHLEAGAKIIICTAKPSWLYAGEYGTDQFNSINYVARIAQGAKGTYSVFAIIAGDLHHYSRYESRDKSLHLVTAGGGGAFVHSTHQLKDELDVPDIRSSLPSVETPSTSFPLGKTRNGAACYPPREVSRRLLWRNLGFCFRNFEFCVGIGVIYWIVSWFFVSHEKGSLFAKWTAKASQGEYDPLEWGYLVLTDVATSPVLSVLMLAIVVALIYYTDTRRPGVQYSVGIAHAFTHIVIFLALALAFRIVNDVVFHLDASEFLTKLLFAAEMIIVGGLIGGFVFGMYLLITSRWLNIHGQEAFSALRMDEYRNFLRLRLDRDSLTIYPIGLEKVPRRQAWRRNPEAAEGLSKSTYVPDRPLHPFLIEPPVVIHAKERPRKRGREERE